MPALPQSAQSSAPLPAPQAKAIIELPQERGKSDPASSAPIIVPLSDAQRIASLRQRADTYMRANRYLEARSLLDDAAKGGDAQLTKALAELYDPLYLREAYPRLVRTGDPERAIALYERAKAAGEPGLEARIRALKALAGPQPKR